MAPGHPSLQQTISNSHPLVLLVWIGREEERKPVGVPLVLRHNFALICLRIRCQRRKHSKRIFLSFH